MGLSVRVSVLALVSVLGLSLPARAQPPVPPMEVVPPETLAGGEAAPAAPPTPSGAGAAAEGKGDAAPKATPVAGWDDMFYIRSADKRYSLRFTGQVQTDFRDALDRGDNTDIDTFLVRRARIGLEAVLFENYEFRFLTDFGQGQTRLVDGYMNIHYWDAFQVTVGKFKQPFSYEQLIQDRLTPFMERSLIDQIVPARDVGVMAHGQNLFNGALDYGASVSNGVQNGDADTNRGRTRPPAWRSGRSRGGRTARCGGSRSGRR